MTDPSTLAALEAENAGVIALLEANGIEWRLSRPVAVVAQEPEPSRLSTAEKVALFRRLFRGRTDVYPVRWESKAHARLATPPRPRREWGVDVDYLADLYAVMGVAAASPGRDVFGSTARPRF